MTSDYQPWVRCDDISWWAEVYVGRKRVRSVPCFTSWGARLCAKRLARKLARLDRSGWLGYEGPA